jgi:hypothetical protein
MDTDVKESFPYFDDWFKDLKYMDTYGIITDSGKESTWGYYINEYTPEEAYAAILDSWGVD